MTSSDLPGIEQIYWLGFGRVNAIASDVTTVAPLINSADSSTGISDTPIPSPCVMTEVSVDFRHLTADSVGPWTWQFNLFKNGVSAATAAIDASVNNFTKNLTFVNLSVPVYFDKGDSLIANFTGSPGIDIYSVNGFIKVGLL